MDAYPSATVASSVVVAVIEHSPSKRGVRAPNTFGRAPRVEQLLDKVDAQGCEQSMSGIP